MQERIWFKIGEAAQKAGVSPKELRYWEKMIPELRPKRSVGNQRHYHKDDLPKLSLIAFWVKSGLPVADCRELVATGGRAAELSETDTESADSAVIAKGTGRIASDSRVPDTGQTQDHPNGATNPSAVPLFDFPEIYDGCAMAQLQGIADSLKALLARLQKSI